MKKLMKVLLPSVLFALMTVSPAMAEKDGSYVFNQQRGCHICHGNDGRGGSDAYTPVLAGQQKAYIVAQLQAFKAKTRLSGDSLKMLPFAAKLSDAEVEAIATFLSGLK